VQGNSPILTILLFLPLAGSIPVLLLRRREDLCRLMALAVAIVELGVAGWACSLGSGATPVSGPFPGFFLISDLPWIERFGIRYTVGLDGISVLLVLLTAFIMCAAVLISRRAVTKHVAAYHALLLVMTTGIMGVFLSLDLFLFYLFWEVMLIPMLLIIGIWGNGRPAYSAIKFFIFTMVGSLLMLLAVIGLYLIHGSQTGQYTFALAGLLHTSMSGSTAFWLFSAFLLAFAIKVPIFPLHNWLPDAYTDAPPAGSLILAALMAKTGAYALIRFAYPLFPSAASIFSPVILSLAVASILYGSWIAYAQQDMKRLIAYSSFGHMGFIVLGIAAWTPVSLSGSVIQMVNHGITTGGLFILLGMLEERGGANDIDAFGDLWGRIPVYSGFFLLFALASVGLPGLNNFVGEFLVLAGVFRVSIWSAVLAFAGIVLVLVYMLRMVQKVLFLKAGDTLRLWDISPREGLVLSVFAIIIVFLGVYPVPLLDLIKTPIQLLTAGSGGLP
jgi:NADH-quinone oxidoreductase subunit M